MMNNEDKDLNCKYKFQDVMYKLGIYNGKSVIWLATAFRNFKPSKTLEEYVEQVCRDHVIGKGRGGSRSAKMRKRWHRKAP